MEEFLKFNNLFDIYKSFLTDNQVEIFKLYYEENLSMQEIADIKLVSKSFVGKSIKDSETKLLELETSLHLQELKEDLINLTEKTDLEVIKNELNKIIDKI